MRERRRRRRRGRRRRGRRICPFFSPLFLFLSKKTPFRNIFLFLKRIILFLLRQKRE